MKILVVSQFYYPEHVSVPEIAEGWVRLGHDVTVVTGQPNYGFGRIVEGYENVVDEVINGVKVHRCKLSPRKEGRLSICKNYLSFWQSSRCYLRRLKEEFDVVYSMSLSPIISVSGANLYAKKHHVRHVLHCLDLWPESTVVTGAIRKGSLAYRILYHWSRSIYKKASEVLVSSPSFESYFRDVLKLKDLPISYVPQPAILGVENDVSILYQNRYNLVYAGNIGTIQLVGELARSIALLPKDLDVHLHLIGMGALSGSVRSVIEQNGLERRITLYGPKSRRVTATYFGNATALVVSLQNAGFVGRTIPLKLTTSLAYSKPILACIGGDGRKVLEQSNGAVFSKTEDAEGFKNAILELLAKTEEEREAMGKRNKALYDSSFRIDTILDRIIEHLAN